MAPKKRSRVEKFWTSYEHVINVIVRVIYVAIVISVALVVHKRVHPYQRGFYCDDQSISYPHTQTSTVTARTLILGCLLPSTALFLLLETLIIVCHRPSAEEKVKAKVKLLARRVGHWTYGHVLGLALTLLVTNIIKVIFGRLRPDFLSVCGPDWSIVDCSHYVTNVTCTRGNPSLTMQYGRTSFPSGHTSLSFYAAVFTLVYLSVRVRWRCIRSALPLVQSALLLVAIYCSASRLHDNKHHAEDVIGGALLGTVMALVMSWRELKKRFWSVSGWSERPGHDQVEAVFGGVTTGTDAINVDRTDL